MKLWIKLLCLSLLISINVASIAGEIQMQTNQVQVNKNNVMAMFRYFETSKTRQLQLSDLNKYYTTNVKMLINGELVSEDIQAFYDHFKLMLSKSRDYQIIFDKNPMIAEGHRVAVKYRIIMLEAQHEKTMHVIAYFTFQNGKISLWDEVVSSSSPHDIGLTSEVKKEN